MKKKYKYLIVILLIVASCAAFGRIADNDFILFDDSYYITENSHIKSGINTKNIIWAFTTTYFSYWHPLTWLSHMLDWSLFGSTASGHHLVSLLLHIGAVIFLFLFLNKTTNNLWPSAFAAALFALHPLRVESVAWASERKDVLSMFFGMACLYAYTFYAKIPKPSKYFLCLILFAMALMSKPMMVTLPFVLLLLDYWPLGRWQKALDEQSNGFNQARYLLWEKVPFFIMTIAASILTVWAQSNVGAVPSLEILPLSLRITNAIISYVAYWGKMFWPVNLGIFYPYDLPIPLWKVLISCIILIIITAAVFYYIRKLPFLFVGWFWYLGTFVPLIGLIQAGWQAMADRHTYLPSVGIAVMLSWGIPLFFKREDIRKKILFPAGIATIAILAILARQQCGYWKNSIELWNHTVQVTKNNAMAHFYLGVAYADLGQYQRAIEDYNETIRLRPDYAYAYYNRGNVYSSLNQYQRAIEDYNEVISSSPNYLLAYLNRGNAYAKLGQYQRAIEDYNEAIRIKPDYADAYINKVIVYLLQGNKELGCRDAQKACELENCTILEEAKSKGYCR